MGRHYRQLYHRTPHRIRWEEATAIEVMDDRDVRHIDWDPSPGNPEMLQIRERLRSGAKCRIAIYDAIGNPSEMSASRCSGFYDMAGDIGVNSLFKLTDRDYHRLVYGESLQQTALLKRCDNLKVLELAVHEPRTFSWARERNPDGDAQRHRGNYLRNLERLYIRMDVGLVVVHDAITAFGQSLRYLKVSGSTIPQELSLGIPLNSPVRTSVGRLVGQSQIYFCPCWAHVTKKNFDQPTNRPTQVCTGLIHSSFRTCRSANGFSHFSEL
ncbi:MAG: hypothetical protein BYD32DRAFT_153166 [Podila humilis]|nr:MAG: hypothetical protein BYD32DRAFT_153166 [Podila humilis]